MAELNVDICPETGICSIGRGGTDKVDLMPEKWPVFGKLSIFPACKRLSRKPILPSPPR